jgi:hypothetical protein
MNRYMTQAVYEVHHGALVLVCIALELAERSLRAANTALGARAAVEEMTRSGSLRQ